MEPREYVVGVNDVGCAFWDIEYTYTSGVGVQLYKLSCSRPQTNFSVTTPMSFKDATGKSEDQAGLSLGVGPGRRGEEGRTDAAGSCMSICHPSPASSSVPDYCPHRCSPSGAVGRIDVFAGDMLAR